MEYQVQQDTKVANYIDLIEDAKEKLNGNLNRDYQSVYSNYNNNHDNMNIRSDANVKEHDYTTISGGAFNLGQWIRRMIRDGNSVTE